MLNEKIKTFFEENNISKGLGKENEYSLSIICNNPNLGGKGVFYIEDIGGVGQNKMYKYLVYQDKKITAKEFFEKNNADFSKFDGYMGIDIETGKPFKVNFIKQLHTLIGGATGSGKSVTLYFILYQLFLNPYTELYILDKNDFSFLSGTKKVIYRGSALEINGKAFFGFIRYFWLEQDRRNKIFRKYGVRDWVEYLEKVMQKDKDAPILNYIYIIIDEYQTLRKMVSDAIGEDKFDNEMKKLLDTVRASGMCFFFGSQDYQKKQIGDMRDSIRNSFFGKMGFCDILSGKELNNIKLNIEGTFLFYHSLTKKFLKIPFIEDAATVLTNLSNDPKNRIKENVTYNTIHEMLNDLLDQADSDIFYDKEGLIEFLHLNKNFIEKLKKTSDYLPFMVLIYVLGRGIRGGTMNRTFNIFSQINFEKEIDSQLFVAIDFFKKEDKFLKLLTETFEASGDQDEFIEKLSDVLNNYLKHILGETRILFGKNDKNVLIKQKELSPDEKFLKENLILEVSYSGDIKPQSVNSMYFIDKNDNFKRSSSTDDYENKLKNLIIQRMQNREIKQYSDKVILDIGFEIELSENKDGKLSGRGRIDLDNLMKSTIDSISKTIIKDDNLVYGIKAKMIYKSKSDSILLKNNKVNIKVYPYKNEIIDIFNKTYNGENYIKKDKIELEIPLNSGIVIPSFNSMYNILGGKKIISANASAYKRLLQESFIKNKENKENLEPTKSNIALYGIIGVFNDEERDLDNMLKATIDAFTQIVYVDDKQILDFFVQKKHVTGLSGYINLSFFEIKDDSIYILNKN